jgi:hypothetical protein
VSKPSCQLFSYSGSESRQIPKPKINMFLQWGPYDILFFSRRIDGFSGKSLNLKLQFTMRSRRGARLDLIIDFDISISCITQYRPSAQRYEDKNNQIYLPRFFKRGLGYPLNVNIKTIEPPFNLNFLERVSK